MIQVLECKILVQPFSNHESERKNKILTLLLARSKHILGYSSCSLFYLVETTFIGSAKSIISFVHSGMGKIESIN